MINNTKQQNIDVVERYINSILVATCDFCIEWKTRKTKKGTVKIKKQHFFRKEISGNPSFCPRCGHALYWERVEK